MNKMKYNEFRNNEVQRTETTDNAKISIKSRTDIWLQKLVVLSLSLSLCWGVALTVPSEGTTVK
jgi:hypothetical protein